MANTLATLVVRLSAETAEFARDIGKAVSITDRQMRDLKRAAADAGRLLGALGAAAALGLGYMVKRSAEAADKLYKLSQSVGVSVDKLSELAYVADLSGVDLETLAKAMVRVAKNANDAAIQTGDALRAFDALGISVKDASGQVKNADVLMEEMADKFAEFEDGANKTALAVAVFGKAGAGLIPYLNLGSKKIREMREEARAFGLTIDTETGRAAEEFNDNLTRMGKALQGLSHELMRQLLPSMVDATNAIVDFAKSVEDKREVVADFVEALQGLASFLAHVATYAVIAAKGMGALLATQIAFAQFRFRESAAILDELSLDTQKSLKRLDSLLAIIRGENTKLQRFTLAEEMALLGVGGPPEAPKKKQAPGYVDRNQLNSIAQAEKALAEARAKIEIEAAKDLAKFKQELLDWQHKQGLVSEHAYWDQRQVLIDEAYAKERAALVKNVEEAEKLLKQRTLKPEQRIAAQKELVEAQAALAKADREYHQQTVSNAASAEDAWRKYRDELAEVEDQILELTGREEEASARRLERQYRELKALTVETFGADSPEAKNIKQLKELKQAQVAFNSERQKLSDLQTAQRLEEERIQNTLKTGARSELEAMQRISEVRQRTVREQEQIVANLQRIAEASKNPELVRQANEAHAALERLRLETDLVADKFKEIFTTAAAEAFADFIGGAKTAKEAFADFARSVVRAINRMVSEAIAAELYRRIFGSAPGVGGTGGGIGGILSSLPGIIISNTIPGTGILGSSIGGTSFAEGLAAGIIPLDHGTDYVPKDMLALLHKGEAVVPAKTNAEGRYGEINVVNNFMVQGTVDRRSQDQVAVASGLGVRRALARNT